MRKYDFLCLYQTNYGETLNKNSTILSLNPDDDDDDDHISMII